MDTPAFDQDIHHGREDDGSETGASFIGAAGSDWTQDVDVNFRCRFVVQETAGFAADNIRLNLRYEKNGAGGFILISAITANVQGALSVHYADTDDTTQQVGSGTFITPNAQMVEGTGTGNFVSFAGSDEVEVEFCVQIVGADVNDLDTFVFRVYAGNNALDTYTDEPTITVNKEAAGLDPMAFLQRFVHQPVPNPLQRM